MDKEFGRVNPQHMKDLEYKDHIITTGYSFSGKTRHYIVWTKGYTDCIAETFTSKEKAKEYINKLKK